MSSIYITYEYWFAAFQLIFAMLGMGATLTIHDFFKVVKTPTSVAIGTVIQLILVPLVTFAFIQATGLIGGVAIGLALIAAIPGGTTSNVFTFFAKGNIPLSISITAITTLACLITTPLVLGLLITQYLPGNFSMPTNQIIKEISLTLLLPLALGMMLLRYWPTAAPTVSKWSIRLSLMGIIAIVVGSASTGRLDMDTLGTHNLLLIIAFVVTITLLSWVITHGLNVSQIDSTAIKMEVIVRNVNLAVLVKASLFPATLSPAQTIGDMVLFTVLLYGVLQMLVAAGLIFICRRS